MKRFGAPENGGENRGEYTFGHNLLTVENVQKLAEQASHWAIVMKFDNNEAQVRSMLQARWGCDASAAAAASPCRP